MSQNLNVKSLTEAFLFVSWLTRWRLRLRHALAQKYAKKRLRRRLVFFAQVARLYCIVE